MQADKPTRFLRRPEVLSLTGLGATTIYLLEQKGEFPKHFMITPRCAGWDADEVAAWLAERKARPAQPLVAPDQAKRRTRPGRQKRVLVEAAA